MFAYLYEWIRNVAFYLVLVTALLHIVPESGYQKYIRFFTGLVLVLLILSPILKVFGMEGELRERYRDGACLESMEQLGEDSGFQEEVEAWEISRNKLEEKESEEAEKGATVEVEEIRIGR